MPKSQAEKQYDRGIHAYAKAHRQAEAAKVKRRAHIRRGMKIALYEINQVLGPHGMEIQFPPGFMVHTVAIAEGGRRDADGEEVIESLARRMRVKQAPIRLIVTL